MSTIASALELKRIDAERSRSRSEQQRVITVRMTKDFHERLKDLAHDQRVSLNTICLAALEAALAELEVKAA